MRRGGWWIIVGKFIRRFILLRWKSVLLLFVSGKIFFMWIWCVFFGIGVMSLKGFIRCGKRSF